MSEDSRQPIEINGAKKITWAEFQGKAVPLFELLHKLEAETSESESEAEPAWFLIGSAAEAMHRQRLKPEEMTDDTQISNDVDMWVSHELLSKLKATLETANIATLILVSADETAPGSFGEESSIQIVPALFRNSLEMGLRFSWQGVDIDAWTVDKKSEEVGFLPQEFPLVLGESGAIDVPVASIDSLINIYRKILVYEMPEELKPSIENNEVDFDLIKGLISKADIPQEIKNRGLKRLDSIERLLELAHIENPPEDSWYKSPRSPD